MRDTSGTGKGLCRRPWVKERDGPPSVLSRDFFAAATMQTSVRFHHPLHTHISSATPRRRPILSARWHSSSQIHHAFVPKVGIRSVDLHKHALTHTTRRRFPSQPPFRALAGATPRSCHADAIHIYRPAPAYRALPAGQAWTPADLTARTPYRPRWLARYTSCSRLESTPDDVGQGRTE